MFSGPSNEWIPCCKPNGPQPVAMLVTVLAASEVVLDQNAFVHFHTNEGEITQTDPTVKSRCALKPVEARWRSGTTQGGPTEPSSDSQSAGLQRKINLTSPQDDFLSARLHCHQLDDNREIRRPAESNMFTSKLLFVKMPLINKTFKLYLEKSLKMSEVDCV